MAPTSEGVLGVLGAEIGAVLCLGGQRGPDCMGHRFNKVNFSLTKCDLG
jgi:hypothetical protein